ncbi:RelA/SpoT domain-containing protein [Ferrimonas senticii]|uniref:RelA/SpoT domain-containing protein n=1 Tax=Ferrimonas senticii TaxID=394566 RepID=UPI00041F94E9|nr:RelA/SpoT domain-containing protein [Ferrimonas senticii]
MKHLFKTALMSLLMVSQSSIATAASSFPSHDEPQLRPALERQDLRFHAGNRLESIPSYQAYPAEQAHNDFELLLQQAATAQQELAMLAHRTAYLTNTDALVPAVKSKQRAQAKLTGKLANQPQHLTDLARVSLVATDIDGVLKAYQYLSKQVEVIRVKNRFASPKANGYRDINMVVRLPQTGHIAEVQLHLESIAAIKNGEEHQIYQQIQQLERQAEPLSEFELARLTKLKQQSTALYHDAWQQLISPTKQLG